MIKLQLKNRLLLFLLILILIGGFITVSGIKLCHADIGFSYFSGFIIFPLYCFLLTLFCVIFLRKLKLKILILLSLLVPVCTTICIYLLSDSFGKNIMRISVEAMTDFIFSFLMYMPIYIVGMIIGMIIRKYYNDIDDAKKYWDVVKKH